ncbi:hypothetical protein KRP22_008548 [Phytophthora ramorum]|nr:hypothetical protein KRP22_7381 [Phytophthora ramorum]
MTSAYLFDSPPDVEKVEQALDKHLKKRAYNEYASLEHQQVHEQIEGLLENLPLPGERDSAKQTSAAAEEEVGIEEYKELLTPLEEEARRLALTKKVKELLRLQTPKDPEHKLLHIEEDDVVRGEIDQHY